MLIAFLSIVYILRAIKFSDFSVARRSIVGADISVCSNTKILKLECSEYKGKIMILILIIFNNVYCHHHFSCLLFY